MRRSDPFYDPRLSPQQNKACEMLFNGFERWEIAEEMDISANHLSSLFYFARKLGVDVPKARPVTRSGATAPRVSTERLVFLSDYLGSMAAAGASVGLTRQAVSQRIKRAA